MAEYPKSAVMWHRYSLVVAGNALSVGHNAAQDFAQESLQSAGADADNFTQAFYLAAGSYTLKALGTTEANSGKIDWYVDGVKIVSGQDWYSAGTVQNVVASASVSIVGNGRHVLSGLVNGKNGASGGYAVYLTSIALT